MTGPSPPAQAVPDWLSATLAADGAAGAGVLPPWIQARSPAASVRGPALVVQLESDDNSPMRAVAAHVSAPGTVVVVCGAEQSQTAVLGDLIATRLVNAGVVAVVTDGLVRDSRAIAELGLPVWCRGVTPRAGAKAGVGRIGGPASLGGVAVSDGDLVVADADGVVVWAADRVAEFLRRAEDKRRADAAGG